MGQTATQIKDYCLEQNIDTSNVSAKKLNNFVFQENVRKNDGARQSTTMTTGGLRLFASEHSPQHVEYDKAAIYKLELSTDPLNPYFFLLISSQKLLDTMAQFGNAHFDATWKCLYSGHPVFIPCFTDHNGKTWQAGVVIASDETHATFVHQMHAVKYLPKVSGPFSVTEQAHLLDGSVSERLAFIP